MDIELIVADYSASNQDSFLAYLDELSKTRADGGFLHGGHIHFIQGKLWNEDGPFLKAAIAGILDRVPSIFPIDLPSRVAKSPDYEITEEMQAAFVEINEGLILPIEGHDILRVISAALEYVELEQPA